MEYRQLGKSELRVPTILFGAWAIGGWYWGGTDDKKAIEAIHAALESGMTCIDTAPAYGFGRSERVVGEALRGKRRSKAILATKCGLRWDREEGELFFEAADEAGRKRRIYRNLRPRSIVEECDQSLTRLGVDVIDLYQCHWPDPTTPLDDTMEALVRLKERGKIREIGVSNFTPAMMETCIGLAPIASDQPRYSPLDRAIEKDVVPFCRERQVGLIVYSPLEQGLLTGKVTLERTFPPGDYRARQARFQPAYRARVLEALESVRPIADRHRATVGQIALAWVLAQPGITAAIVGARSPDQVVENAGASAIRLSPDEIEEVARIFDAVGSPEEE